MYTEGRALTQTQSLGGRGYASRETRSFCPARRRVVTKESTVVEERLRGKQDGRPRQVTSRILGVNVRRKAENAVPGSARSILWCTPNYQTTSPGWDCQNHHHSTNAVFTRALPNGTARTAEGLATASMRWMWHGEVEVDASVPRGNT